MLKDLHAEMVRSKNPEKAIHLMRFFKTGDGDYGQGDIFYGLTVPESRKIAAKYYYLSLTELSELLHAKAHEERLIALLILIWKYKKGDTVQQKEVYEFYLSHTKYINNWDLVDTSADKIVGEYLFANGKGTSTSLSDKKVLVALAKSSNLWQKRIAILSTFTYINHGESAMTFEIADILLHDKHDLIQKAVGWLIREVGKRVSEKEEEDFLKTRYKTMPRTMLRYAIERFPKEKRKQYLLGLI